MNPQFLTVLLGTLSVCATACGIGYIVLRLRTLTAYRLLLEADGDAVMLARETYFGLDKRQKRLAIFILAIYGLTFLALSPFLQPASSLSIGCLILITLSVLSVGLTASICNDKEWTARMHDDSRRRINRFRAPQSLSAPALVVDGLIGDSAAKLHTAKPLPVPQTDTCIPGRPSPLAGNSGLPDPVFVDTPRKTTCFSPHVHDIFAKGGKQADSSSVAETDAQTAAGSENATLVTDAPAGSEKATLVTDAPAGSEKATLVTDAPAGAGTDQTVTARQPTLDATSAPTVATTDATASVLEAQPAPDRQRVDGGTAIVAAETAPFSLIMIGDFGKDMDDEDTLVLSDGINRHQVVSTHGSRRQELFEMLAVIANLAPAAQRGRLAKGTLRLLGRPDVPVGVGTDCGLRADGHEKEFEGVTYLAGTDDLEPGADLLVRSLESADDGSVILLLISGLTDAAALLREHDELVQSKVALVAIMGGVEQKDNAVVKDDDGYMIPDSAANNKFDMDAAKYFYRRVQELCIPTTILTREAAYAAPVPRDLYDRMAATGHPVGVKLQRTQRHAIQDVWVRANMAADDPRRNKLPERCNKEWFCNTFCAGQGLDRNGDDDIWDLIQSFQLYDPMTLIAAVPELAERFFEPTIVTVNGVDHSVIGVSKAKNGVKDPAGLSTFMIECFITSLVANTDKAGA